jgi:hypothetical protein
VISLAACGLPTIAGPRAQELRRPGDRRYFSLWRADRTLLRPHQALCLQVREEVRRAAGPTVAILDSAKVAQKGGLDRPAKLRRGQEGHRPQAPHRRRQLDDFDLPTADVGDAWSLVLGIGEQPDNRRKLAIGVVQQAADAIEIPMVGATGDNAQQQAESRSEGHDIVVPSKPCSDA